MYMGRGLLVKKPKAHKDPKKKKAITPNFRISLLLVEFEFIAPVPFLLPGRLFFLE